MADQDQPMPAQVVIPSGWAVLRGDKQVRPNDRYLSFGKDHPTWVPVGSDCRNVTAADFGFVIFRLHGRSKGGKSNG